MNKRDSHPPDAPFCCVHCCRVPPWADLDEVVAAFRFERRVLGIEFAEGVEFTTYHGPDAPLVRVGRFQGFCLRCNRRLEDNRLSLGMVEPGMVKGSSPTIFWCRFCANQKCFC